ncbi:TetR/AcrR family transcriptional regulator [Oceanisphaera psychrotolerans]|uniref:NADH dehydrogenase n=1 Tax=Oceanisphaera psychrotolerans TaxID=1414654 RepID=A0A1J4QL29_9GAMM|nr:TetR/AcrR family transcriptional regulator [Oceanisphaera psychrotolerans]OIN14336.1 NADH dehydrogenase [Oceanisphaera psychrotolerans]
MSDKRERILSAAETLIARCGFQGMSMHLVAQHAGVATGTIYRYFADKETLLRCVHEERMQEIGNRVTRGLDPGASCYDQFRTLWLNTIHCLLDSPDCLLYRVQYEASPLFSKEEDQELHDRYFKPVFEFFEQGLEEGLFRELPAEVLCGMTLENLLLLTQKHTKGRIDLHEGLYESLIDANWNAILKR